jgi:hypothetical protein
MRKRIGVEKTLYLVQVVRRPTCPLLIQPFPSDRLESVSRLRTLREPLFLPMVGGMGALLNQGPRVGPRAARMIKGNVPRAFVVEIFADGKNVLFACDAVAVPPKLSPGRADFEIEALAVSELDGSGAGFRIADFGVGQGMMRVLL